MHFAHYSSLGEIKIGSPLVMAIGVFDGLHLGHRQLFKVLLEESKKKKAKSAVWTFNSKIPKPKFCRLMNESTYLSGLEKLGVEEVHKMDFIEEVSQMSAREFLKKVLISKLNVQSLVIGEDARLGRDRATSANEFQELAAEVGLEVHLVPLLEDEKGVISSSRIREALLEGRFTEVDILMGESFQVSGEVTKDQQLGRTIGFPTANIKDSGTVFPPKGVYKTEVDVSGKGEKWLKAMSYVGSRPTVDESGEVLVLETHIPNWSGDLYGKVLTVRSFNKIRDEMKFSSVEELKVQLKKDLKLI